MVGFISNGYPVGPKAFKRISVSGVAVAGRSARAVVGYRKGGAKLHIPYVLRKRGSWKIVRIRDAY